MSKLRLLLVEDNRADQALLKEAIRAAGWDWEVWTVENGADALLFLHGKGAYRDSVLPDLIVLDLNMPRMGGVTLLGLIKQDPRLSQIPTVVMTTSRSLEDKRAASQADLFLSKEADIDAYFEAVRSGLGRWARGGGGMKPRAAPAAPPSL